MDSENYFDKNIVMRYKMYDGVDKDIWWKMISDLESGSLIWNKGLIPKIKGSWDNAVSKIINL